MKTGWKIALLAIVPLANLADDCASCHDQAEKIAATAHAPVACATCHPKHEEYPHPAGVPKPACQGCHSKIAAEYASGVHSKAVAAGNLAAPACTTCHGGAHAVPRPAAMEFRKKMPDTCGMCHSDIAGQFRASVHGKALASGVAKAPVCNDCHGEHMILSKRDERSPVHARNIRETCAGCHASLALARRFGLPADRIITFDASFHGLAAKGGSQTVANCASCHGVHNILPSKDPRSTIHSQNLAATCGKCHPGAGTRFAIGPVHQAAGGQEPRGVAIVRAFYLVVIPVTIGLMFLHNFGDWVRKLVRAYRGLRPGRANDGDGDLRMYRFERFAHALMAAAFLVLAWSGFALQYPDRWWAQPLMIAQTRRDIHRIAAVVLTAVGVAHGIALVASRGLREHWLGLAPRMRDVRDGVAMLAYNVGLRRRAPDLPQHSYVEKAEYWAVVWGSAVMIVTGAALWANNISLRWLPKSWLDVATAIHLYEAILAVLAVVVWHFYWVIFDPEVYPMDTAWLTGRTVRKRQEDEPLQ